MMTDIELLREYAKRNSDEAFQELVERHTDLVYSAAFRQLRDAHLAKDVTQTVFIALARKAGGFPPGAVVEGWLFRAAHFAALNAARRAQRQEHWIQTAAQMENPTNDPVAGEAWEQMVPILNETMAQLWDTERDALLLRFFKGRSFRDVGAGLGLSEDAAKKRVARALEKLRALLGRRGVVLPAAAVAAALSAHAVQAAPVGLAAAVAASASKGASGTTLTLAKELLKLMAWTKGKIAAVTAAGVLLAAGTVTVTVKEIAAHHPDESWRTEQLSSRMVERFAPQVRIVPTKFARVGNLVGGAGDKFVGVGRPPAAIAQIAYDWPPARIRFAGAEPPGRYDFITTVDHPREALQREMKRTLGLAGHPQTEDTDVLVLSVRNPNAPGFTPAKTGGNFWMNRNGENCEIRWDAEVPTRLTIFLESIFQQPVIDKTGLTNECSLDLKWRETGPNDPDHRALREVLLKQLGLELVPGREPVEMLVVSKEPAAG